MVDLPNADSGEVADAALNEAIALYANYVQLSQYASIVEIAHAESPTWLHHPEAPLSIVVHTDD